MSDPLSEFSEEQWAFLAVLDAFRSPVFIELAGNLAPLLPGPLIDLLDACENRGLIKKIGKKQLTIGDRLPSAVRRKLDAINSAEHLSMLIDRMRTDEFEKRMDGQSRVRLMYRAGRVREAAALEIDMAQQAFETKDYEKGRAFLHHAVSRLDDAYHDPESQVRFIAGVLQLSNISFSLGKGFIEIDKFLHKAHEVSSQLGDKRSHALINLHLGRLYYFTDRRENALVALSLGTEEIEELGDSDIILQSAPFLGLYFFLRGHFKKAFEYLEKAEQIFKSGDGSLFENSMIPIFFGYCAAYLGKFHRAIGHLDFTYRLALERSDKALASTIRAVLGTVLVLLRKPQEAAIHYNRAREDARETHNALGLYLCGGAVALSYFLEGRMEKAYEVVKQTIPEGFRAGLVRQFSSPWVLEMLYEFHRLGFDPIPDFEYPKIIESIFKGVNVHLQGVALRLKVKEKERQDDDQNTIVRDLEQSMKNLRESGDPIQLSKTLLEMARLKLTKGSNEEARKLAHEARRCLGGYIDEFFPLEYQHLVDTRDGQIDRMVSKEEFMENYLEMLESLYPSESRDEILAKVLIETSRMFGAERSALFWFPLGEFKAAPELRSALNLSLKEVTADNFKASLNAILRVFNNNKPLVEKRLIHETILGRKISRSILCIPVEVQNRVHGVLYYDNSYLENAFQFLDLSTIKRMARHTNLVVERRFEHLKIKKQAEALSSEKSMRLESAKKSIIARSSKMIKLLEKVDKIAETESTVLIQGETGTGKELLAYRIYNRSIRAGRPFVVVDSTTIPENLLESELFGYEKGAFTGADQRKIGCIEMAHQGTLFLDEVGELTLPAQAKLLRALQEKMIRRVGGVQTIKSDFRLIAATNRDLAQEVAKGQFRDDLFYRLNVISLTLPPLRDRGEDAVSLAQHFIDSYSKKYKRSAFKLYSEQKASIKKYTWPGNIRELKNKVESAVILSGEDRLELDLPSGKPMPANDPFADKPTLKEIQRRYIRHVIDFTDGRISGHGGAVDILGMKRTSLYARMKALGMKR
jgi:transcriptional regulator with GAF, ATPase, and Fis domain